MSQSSAHPNYVGKYMRKVLAHLAEQLGHAEDGIAPLTHAEGMFQFISHAGTHQGIDCAHEVAQPRNGDTAIDLALCIAQADHHVGASELWVDCFFQALQQSRIVFQRGDSGDQLRLHEWLSKAEGVDIGYALKYARKLLSGPMPQGGAA